MKYTKAASVLAVSMVAVGAASSSAAAGNHRQTSPSMSLNSGVQQLADAYNTHTKALDNPLPLVGKVKDAAQQLNAVKDANPLDLVTGAVGGEATGSMLGGLPIGG